MIVAMINSLLSLLGSAASSVLSLLPNSPFSWDFSGTSVLLQFVFWLIPVPQILTLMTSYVTAVASYYLIRTVLRWLKVVGG